MTRSGLIIRCLAAFLLLAQGAPAPRAIAGPAAVAAPVYVAALDTSLPFRASEAVSTARPAPAFKPPHPTGPTAALQPASGPGVAAAVSRGAAVADRSGVRPWRAHAFWARGPPGPPRADARQLS
jgi:hypothetical protein